MKFFFFFILFIASSSAALPPPNVQGASVVVLDANNGTVLYSRNPNEPRTVGSTQKILTALIVAENANLNRSVTIEPIDEKTEPTMLNLKPGDTYTREELLNGMLIKSANDAARVLARDEAGSIENFALLMNQKAQALGANSSHFVNPNGLPGAQYSTAADMAKIAIAVYHNSKLRSIIATKCYPFHLANGDTLLLKNTNETMNQTSFCNGMKTGYTNKSKHCLITSGSYQGHDAITVILGTSNRNKLFSDSADLLGWALNVPLVQKVTHYVKNHSHSTHSLSLQKQHRKKHSKHIVSSR